MKVEILGPNNCIIYTDAGNYCQSYSTIIVHDGPDGIFLDPKHGCSSTTAKHRNKFLNMTSAEVKAKIKSGEFKVRRLND